MPLKAISGTNGTLARASSDRSGSFNRRQFQQLLIVSWRLTEGLSIFQPIEVPRFGLLPDAPTAIAAWILPNLR
jgi:hypothetical protein